MNEVDQPTLCPVCGVPAAVTWLWGHWYRLRCGRHTVSVYLEYLEGV